MFIELFVVSFNLFKFYYVCFSFVFWFIMNYDMSDIIIYSQGRVSQIYFKEQTYGLIKPHTQVYLKY